MWFMAAAYPLLVKFIELRELTRGDILPPFGVLVLGCWFAFETSRRAVVNDDGISFETIFGKKWVFWSDLVGVDLVRANFVFRDRFGVRHVVSEHANEVQELAEEARRRVGTGA
jgi:hypothetical protein